MKKTINIIATIVSLVLYFVIAGGLSLGGFALIGHLVMHIAFPALGIPHTLLSVVLATFLIFIPVVGVWTCNVCKAYIKIIIRIDRPFITPVKPVFALK